MAPDPLAPFKPGLPQGRVVLAAIVLLLAACQGGPGNAPAATRARRPVEATPAATPARPAPALSPAASPPVATPSPAAATPAPVARRLAERLLAVAQVGFAQARTRLASDRTLLDATPRRVGILGNNGGGLISDQGGGILGNNGGGLISDQGGGILGNNGAGLTGGAPAGFRLRQLSDTAAAVSLTPLPGETAIIDRRWAFGGRTLSFSNKGLDTSQGYRHVVFGQGGLLTREERYRPTTFWPSGAWQTSETRETGYATTGAAWYQVAYASDKTASGTLRALKFLADPPAVVREPGTGVVVRLQRFEIDTATHTGAFEYVYEHLGATETGTLEGVHANPEGAFLADYGDPLSTYDGEATLRNRTGAVVFTKRQRTEGGRKLRTYDLQGGLTAELALGPEGTWQGQALEGGKAVAGLRLDVRPDGSTLFTLTLPEQPQAPIELGFGILDAPTGSPPPIATEAPLPVVSSLAGDPAPGFVDGAGPTARFGTLLAIAPSRRDPAVFYLADPENHRIRTLRLGADGAATVGTLVGTSQAGFVSGSLAETRLGYPVGLVTAAGPAGSETLYVSEIEGVIRRITLQADGSGRTEVLAGTGARGAQDGPGLTATFGPLWGMAHDAGAGRLYVLEPQAHRIRAVDLTQAENPVSTVAGGTEGFADGPAAVAQFADPMALAVDAEGRLLVADAGNRRVRRLDPRATPPRVETVAGSGTPERAFFDGPALSAGMNAPQGLGLLPSGELLIGNACIRSLDVGTGILQTLAGGVEEGTADGDVQQARFEEVRGFALAQGGTILVIDGNRVRAIGPPRAPTP
jgi:hypothetical protein